ncbi:hypothetical protein UlMin_017004 [Ulmus minor]
MGSDDKDRESALDHVSRKFMFVVTFSLFALTVFVVFLYFYARYLRSRRQERNSRRVLSLSRLTALQILPFDGNLEQLQPPKTGLTPSAIASIPQFVYNSKDDQEHSEAIECSVCLSSVKEGAMVRLLPNCKHMFHVECIDMWLGSNTTCPICRAEVEPKEQSGSNPVVPVQPTAPPVEESLAHGSAQIEKGSGSGSRLSSFRKMLNRERSSKRSAESCGEASVHHDLEKQ